MVSIELEQKDPSLNDKLDELTKLLQEINLTLNQKKVTDCFKGHENPNLETQQAMRDVDNKETDLYMDSWEDFHKKMVDELHSEHQL
ncbi:hypothetical protein [Helicobacter cetorum]|uniref:hypothetical protein n=1 Tax=Helicobacter cetorum TaxID=138563 RepID=UPI001F27620F|nr:hypothetical protein [Helicobacter cetorum]